MKKKLNKQKNWNKTKHNKTETKEIKQNKAKNKPINKQTETIVYTPLNLTIMNTSIDKRQKQQQQQITTATDNDNNNK